jgi:antitoxin CptB
MSEAASPTDAAPVARGAGAGGAGAAPLDARALSKLRWRCRRGLLENDLLIERFFARPMPVTESDAAGLRLLMGLADNDLLDLFLGREKPTANLDRPEVRQVIEAVRAAR